MAEIVTYLLSDEKMAIYLKWRFK